MFLILLTNALFALTYVIAEYVLHFTSPLLLLMYRMLLSGIILVGFQFFKDKKKLIIKKNHLFSFLVTILLHMSLNFLCETYALQKISGVMVSLFYLLAPIFSAVIDLLLKNNTLSKSQWGIIFTGLCSSLAMILVNAQGGEMCFASNHKGIEILWAYLLLLGSIISSTLAWYRVKDLITDQGYSLVTINGYASLFSGFLFAGILLILRVDVYTFSTNIIFYKVFFGSFLLGLVGNIFAYNLYQSLLRHYSITAILLAEIFCPCFTSLYMWLFFDQVPRFNYIIFFFIFLFCVLFFNYKERAKQQIV